MKSLSEEVSLKGHVVKTRAVREKVRALREYLGNCKIMEGYPISKLDELFGEKFT